MSESLFIWFCMLKIAVSPPPFPSLYFSSASRGRLQDIYPSKNPRFPHQNSTSHPQNLSFRSFEPMPHHSRIYCHTTPYFASRGVSDLCGQSSAYILLQMTIFLIGTSIWSKLHYPYIPSVWSSILHQNHTQHVRMDHGS